MPPNPSGGNNLVRFRSEIGAQTRALHSDPMTTPPRGSRGAGLSIGVCGAGRFASSFIPLFKVHPLVGEVRLAEAFPERRAEQAARLGIEKTYASLDELCDSDVDAIALF